MEHKTWLFKHRKITFFFLVFLCLWVTWLVVCWLFEIVVTVMFSFPHPWKQDSPACFWSAIYRGWAACCRQACALCFPSTCCDPVLSDFSLKVNLGKSAVGGWSCRESVSFRWLSKPWRWATQRNRGEISWEKQASWGSSITPTSSTLKASSQKVGTSCCGLLSLYCGWWELVRGGRRG